jgi:hypothetical protein
VDYVRTAASVKEERTIDQASRARHTGKLNNSRRSRLQTPDSRLQTPDSRLQTPDARRQTPGKQRSGFAQPTWPCVLWFTVVSGLGLRGPPGLFRARRPRMVAVRHLAVEPATACRAQGRSAGCRVEGRPRTFFGEPLRRGPLGAWRRALARCLQRPCWSTSCLHYAGTWFARHDAHFRELPWPRTYAAA